VENVLGLPQRRKQKCEKNSTPSKKGRNCERNHQDSTENGNEPLQAMPTDKEEIFTGERDGTNGR
jgi:hypothetical protein